MVSTSYGPQRRPPQRPKADQQEPAAGRWVDGQFTFATPEAAEAWQRRAYQQAVNEKTWHLGDKIDDQTRNAILAGIGGATRPMYQGPDGQYYFQNARTLEDPSARSHRAQHVAGKTIDQIAAAGKIPGEDEYVAARRAPLPKPANDNPRARIPAMNTAVNDNIPASPRAFLNRNQHVVTPPPNPTGEDESRLLMQGVSGDTADYGRAAIGALQQWWDGKSFSEAYDTALKEEERLTAEARERLGIAGIAIEAAPGLIPVVGDVIGAVADAKDLIQNGEDWSWGDYGLLAAGVLPGVPNRKTMKAGKKIIDGVVDGTHGIDSGKLLQEGKKKPRTIDDMLPTSEDFHTEGQARTLNTEPIGMSYVQEKPSKNLRANEHEEGAEGQLYNTETRYPYKPALRFKNSDPKGRDFMKFDGKGIYTDHILMIERKTSYPWGRTKGMRQILTNYRKSREALAQNNNVGEGEPVFKIMYELGTEEEAARVLDHMIQEGVDDILAVRVGKRWDEQND